MERLVVNLSGSAKRIEEHIVAPLSMIVPGVLPGSQGPLFYPEKEVSEDPIAWNNIPIIVRHPHDGGSARRQKVWEDQGIGHLQNSRFENGKLRADGYFHVERTKKIDSRIYQNLMYGIPMELSTGLYTTNTPAPTGSHYQGVPYTHIASDYRPDHLAILPDERGACSLTDGCGVFNYDASGSLYSLDAYQANLESMSAHSYSGHDIHSLEYVTTLISAGDNDATNPRTTGGTD